MEISSYQKEEKDLKETRYDIAIRKMREEGKKIIGEFTGREALDNFLYHFWDISLKMKEDAELNAYFTDLR